MENTRDSSAGNPLGLHGIEFVEFASPEPDRLHKLFEEFGFQHAGHRVAPAQDYYRQRDIHFVLNRAPAGAAGRFASQHGPSISAMGWRFADARQAHRRALERGARDAGASEFVDAHGRPMPAIFGIGDSLIYFVEALEVPDHNRYARWGFEPVPSARQVSDLGFRAIDHLTNNVEPGTMSKWADFYKSVFGFTEVRYFDIKGAQTGLQSYALRSPDGSFCIPINEGTEEKSQINEYLREYRGPGIQHLAFLTDDIVSSLRGLRGTSIQTLDMDEQYYREVFARVPNVTEDRQTLRELQILVDGDDEGYLLQIFTRNLIGPIFVEIIQRKNHHSFGEGNFGALFRSIERDQSRRGVFGKCANACPSCECEEGGS